MPDRPVGAAFRSALRPAIARRSLVVALVVGTILNLINQGDALLHGGDINVVKLALTYAVPFCVATYGAFCALRAGAGMEHEDPRGPARQYRRRFSRSGEARDVD